MISLLLCMALGPLFDLTQYEVFNFNYTLIYGLPNQNYLIQAKLENKLIVIDPQGEILAKRDNEGSGPGDLAMPIVLRVLDDHFMVNMDDGRVEAYDFKLNHLKDKSFRKLPIRILGSQYLEGNFYFLRFPIGGYHFQTGSNYYQKVELIGSKWKEHEKLFPVTFEDIIPSFYSGFQTGLLYKRFIKVADDYYRIEVYALPETDEPVMIMGRSLESLPDFDTSRIFLTNSLRSKDRYYIQISLTDQKYKRRSNWLDIYHLNGDFIKRMTVPNDLGISPVLNTDRVLAFSEDEMLYWPIGPYLAELP